MADGARRPRFVLATGRVVSRGDGLAILTSRSEAFDCSDVPAGLSVGDEVVFRYPDEEPQPGQRRVASEVRAAWPPRGGLS